jgi:hypothetical protein
VPGNNLKAPIIHLLQLEIGNPSGVASPFDINLNAIQSSDPVEQASSWWEGGFTPLVFIGREFPPEKEHESKP